MQAVRWFLRTQDVDWSDARGVQDAIRVAATMTVGEIRQAARLAGRPGDAQNLIRLAYSLGEPDRPIR